MKKRIAAFLSIMMLFAIVAGTMAHAVDQPTAQIVISNKVEDTGIDLTGKSFGVYQLFTATVDNSTAVVGDTNSAKITYTLNSQFTNFFKDLPGFAGIDPVANATDFQKAAEAYIHDQKDLGKMQDLVTALQKYVKKTPSLTKIDTITGAVHKVDGVQSLHSKQLDPGYYLVLDQSTNGSTITAGMLASIPTRGENSAFTENATIYLKGSQPDIDKQIWHNDKNNTGAWDQVGDYEIGDTVEFLIKATVPEDLQGYTPITDKSETANPYTYIITDTMSKGLSYDTGSLVVYLNKELTQAAGGVYHTEYYPTKPDPVTDEYEIFVLTFDMVGIKNALPDLEEFYIKYTATVTKDALIADDFEKNTVKLQFSNNPYVKDSFGEAEDTVHSYTFAMDVLKTDATGVNTLADAKFMLLERGLTEGATETPIFLLQDATDKNLYYVQQSGTIDEASNKGIIVTDATGKFTINGLDDARHYILREIEAPAGYSKADDLEFKITADYSDAGVLTKVKTTNDTVIDVLNHRLDTVIINSSSEVLPGTGGMGTVIFIVIGSVLMAGAAGWLLISNKKDKAKH